MGALGPKKLGCRISLQKARMPQRPLYQGNVLPSSNEVMLVRSESTINPEPSDSVAQEHISEQGDMRQSWQTRSDLTQRGRELSHPEMH